jgi:hypothetical protein
VETQATGARLIAKSIKIKESPHSSAITRLVIENQPFGPTAP